MYCDALTLAAVVQELRDHLLGGRIQQVLLLHRLAIGLEVYAHQKRHNLLISAQPEEGGRIHLVPDKLRRGPDTLSPLVLRLRKQAQAARLLDIQQPEAERLVQLTLESEEGTVVLVAEIMGRRSNILLLDDDVGDAVAVGVGVSVQVGVGVGVLGSATDASSASVATAALVYSTIIDVCMFANVSVVWW